jgi:hypothetical protein
MIVTKTVSAVDIRRAFLMRAKHTRITLSGATGTWITSSRTDRGLQKINKIGTAYSLLCLLAKDQPRNAEPDAIGQAKGGRRYRALELEQVVSTLPSEITKSC